MNEQELKHIIEATLLAAGRPVSTQQLLELFDERERPAAEELRAALDLLAADYAARGIELVEVASGWRVQVRPRCADVVSRLWQERPSRYSRALLETLALVAYRQPITRSEIEEIRGVSISSTIMRTLQERNWIRVVGHREVPGRPELLGTTREFLDYFSLKSLDQLPTLAELKDVETIGVQLELGAEPGNPQTGTPAADAEEAGVGAADVVESAADILEGAPRGHDAEQSEARSEAQSEAQSEARSEDQADDGEPPADAAGEDDFDSDSGEERASPTLVASAEDDDDARRGVREPDRESDQ